MGLFSQLRTGTACATPRAPGDGSLSADSVALPDTGSWSLTSRSQGHQDTAARPAFVRSLSRFSHREVWSHDSLSVPSPLHPPKTADDPDDAGHKSFISATMQTGFCDWSARYFAQPVMKVLRVISPPVQGPLWLAGPHFGPSDPALQLPLPRAQPLAWGV